MLATCHFPALCTLRLDDNQLGDAGVIAIANAPWAENLRMLTIGQWGGGKDKPSYTDEGFRALCESPHLSNLTSLSITGSFTGDLAAVMNKLNWPNLRDLHFIGLHLRDEGALKIITSEFARNLITLTLENCRLSDQTLNAIQEHGSDWQLGLLRLSNNRFEKYGLATLAEKGTLPKLRGLNVSYCDMMIPTLMRFAQTAFAKRLRQIVLYGNATSAQLQTLIAGREYATLGADWLEQDHLRNHNW
jgi:Leucine-rich repeat (LRR) protein